MFDSAIAAPTKEQVLADLRRRIASTGPATAQPAAPKIQSTSPIQPAATSVVLPTVPAVAGSAAIQEWSGDVLPVAEALAGLLPRGGLPRGGVISIVSGGGQGGGGQAGGGDQAGGGGSGGASSLLLSLLAGPERRWSALVGLPGIGLLAAAEFGVDLDRLVVVPDPGPDVLQVLSVLADGVDLIAVGAPGGALGTPARLRVLTGRLRQHGAVLLVSGQWPGADLVLSARHTGWVGIGRGTGRLRDRQLTVSVGGRRAGAHGKEVTILLSGHRNGTVVASAPSSQLIELPAPISAAV
ncbi:MAG: hypothetical protein M3Y77_03685 [Actinomycetota bacterium]|nr:hypothetical protein [Actinomycetota bacterium]